jgi:hypothetical protein
MVVRTPDEQPVSASENSLDPSRDHLEEVRGEPALPRATTQNRQLQVMHQVKPTVSAHKRATGRHPLPKNIGRDSALACPPMQGGETQEALPGETGAPMYGQDGDEASVE